MYKSVILSRESFDVVENISKRGNSDTEEDVTDVWRENDSVNSFVIGVIVNSAKVM